MKSLFYAFFAAAVTVIPALSAPSLAQDSPESDMTSFVPLTETNTVADLVSHPAFAGFGAHLLPRPQDAVSDIPLRDAGRLMPWHSHVNPEDMLRALNRLISDSAAGRKVFYEFSEDAGIRAQTGLFYFRGKKGAPFALIFPGGGFVYVGSLHEGFPPAQALSGKGYNAFVLQYRTGGSEAACEDMAAALSFIFRNAEELGVSARDYSLWGGSAGARMAAFLGSYGAAAFGGDRLPPPAAVVMCYTGHGAYRQNEPPTFAAVSEDDPIASPMVMARRIEALNAAGTDTEFHLFKHAGHGFGQGSGTDAAGWTDLAVRFWEKHMTD